MMMATEMKSRLCILSDLDTLRAAVSNYIHNDDRDKYK
jgi:hypothetical protein